MLYKIVRPFARITLKVFFRKIHLAHAERVPADQAVILVANHPAAFMEPCLLSVFQPNDLYFLTKGDLFKKAWHAKFLRSLHMVPIYGRADGVENIKKNASTLSFCHQALKKNQSVLVMAEGHTVHEKRLRPIQKGPARLAFGAIEKNGPMDLLIIPVGVNYTYAEKFREEVMFDFGTPINVMDYWADYENQAAKAIKELTKLIAKRLREQVVVIEDSSDDELVEQLLLINRNQETYSILPIIVDNKDQLIDEIQIADRVNHMQADKKAALKLTANEYFEKLAKNQITDFALKQPGYYNFGVSLALVLGFLPFLFGYVLNYLPAWITSKFAQAKAKRTGRDCPRSDAAVRGAVGHVWRA